jgi:glucose/arabinose dehydrogenase
MAAVFLVVAFAAPLAAQQTVPFRNNIPVAPQGLSLPPLPAAPVRYETAEGQSIELTVVTRGLARPWSFAFVASDTILVTERGGTLRVIRGGKLEPAPVAGVPMVRAEGLAGLMDIALHPDFATNGYVYLSTASRSAPMTRPSRSRAAAGTAARCATPTTCSLQAPRRPAERALAFGGDGMLYVSAGGAATATHRIRRVTAARCCG